MSDRTAYLAAEGYTDELAHELGAVERKHGRLLVATGSPRPAAWAANVWLDPHEIKEMQSLVLYRDQDVIATPVVNLWYTQQCVIVEAGDAVRKSPAGLRPHQGSSVIGNFRQGERYMSFDYRIGFLVYI